MQFIIVDVDLVHLGEIVLGFSTIKLLIPTLTPLDTVLLKGSYYVQPTLKEWEVVVHLLDNGISTYIF